MKILIEILLELIFEGSMELSTNKKVPKWIRYPLIAIITLFCLVFTVGILVIGILLLKEHIYAGIIMVIIGLILVIQGTIKFRKMYIKKKN